MSSWRQTTKHVVCPAAAHLPIHAPPVPKAATKPICVSITPLFSSGNSTNGVFLFLFVCLSVCLSSLWSANYILFKLLLILSFFLSFFPPVLLSFSVSSSQCLLQEVQLIYQLFMPVAAHYTDRATCPPSADLLIFLFSFCRRSNIDVLSDRKRKLIAASDASEAPRSPPQGREKKKHMLFT